VPYITNGSRRIGRLVGVIAGIALSAFAAPAAQAASPVPVGSPSCVPEAKLTHPFELWGDLAPYTLVPGGDFESRPSGWTLRHGARIVDGNEPFHVGSPNDRRSLSLADDGSAISAPVCIDESYPSFRLFAQNRGDRSSKLEIDVLYLDAAGRVRSRNVSEYVAGSRDWAPTQPIIIGLPFANGPAPVAFRFTADDEDGDWLIDDVYVDPMAR
jgi:hypothetical protein